MFKPSDFSQQPRGLRLAAVIGLVLVAATLGAAAGIASDADRNALRLPSAAAAPNQKAPATYQLRCWQYGRLLFDEGPVTLGAEARRAARLVAIDRNGAALLVTTAGDTTCLARAWAAAPNLALPH